LSAKIVWTRRAARFLGTAPVVFGWFMIVAELIAGPTGDADGEGVFVGLALIALTAAALTAWRWERIGGIAEIVAAVAFGFVVYLTAGRNQLIVATLLPLPWFVSGLLFLALDWNRRRYAGG
jgi:hypothetical protein